MFLMVVVAMLPLASTIVVACLEVPLGQGVQAWAYFSFFLENGAAKKKKKMKGSSTNPLWMEIKPECRRPI